MKAKPRLGRRLGKRRRTRGAFSEADLLKRIDGREPFMDGGFAMYFVRVDFIPAPAVSHHNPGTESIAFHEMGPFAWVPFSEVARHLQSDVDRTRKFTVDRRFLPRGSETDWFWPTWLRNMRAAVVQGALPWMAQE